MNTIIAQGAPGSMIRKFQDQPQLGVELLNALAELLEDYKAIKRSLVSHRQNMFPGTDQGAVVDVDCFPHESRAMKAIADVTVDAKLRAELHVLLSAALKDKNREGYYAALDRYLAL